VFFWVLSAALPIRVSRTVSNRQALGVGGDGGGDSEQQFVDAVLRPSFDLALCDERALNHGVDLRVGRVDRGEVEQPLRSAAELDRDASRPSARKMASPTFGRSAHSASIAATER
jgi:hypothetical protein